jgi:ankyrin repeat protein
MKYIKLFENFDSEGNNLRFSKSDMVNRLDDKIFIELNNNKADEENIKFLIHSGKSDVSYQDSNFISPIHIAAGKNLVEVCEELVLAGANPMAEDKWGETPLHWVAENGAYDVCEFLLGLEEVNPDVQDERGQTPLHKASEGDNIEIIGLLINGGADPNIQDEDFKTPFDLAISKGAVRMLGLYMEDKNMGNELRF